MGMTKVQVLTRIELPLAVPIIIAGVRTAMILNIGMATLGFLIGGGGLGITIQTGLKLNQDEILIVGAWLVALVALTFDWLGAVAERFLGRAVSEPELSSPLEGDFGQIRAQNGQRSRQNRCVRRAVRGLGGGTLESLW